MKTNTFLIIAYATIWIAVSAAVVAGLIITKNAKCLWAFGIPALIRVRTGNNENEDGED